ncbi:phage repressor protein [Rahnella aquatilis]|nr:phage repressor protein [Rahnella aquatilis]
MELDKGGRGAIERMVEAYGFTTRQALCEKLGVSKSTLATRYMRDSFPSDWVIQCALETGVALKWLTFGSGPIYQNAQTDVIEVPRKKIVDGQLVDASYIMFDKVFAPETSGKLEIITIDSFAYFIDSDANDIEDGLWVLEIEGKVSIREIVRIPIGRIKILGTNPFECSLEDIKFLSKVVGVFQGLK